MTKEEYGELLKYLGILKYSIHKLRDILIETILSYRCSK